MGKEDSVVRGGAHVAPGIATARGRKMVSTLVAVQTVVAQWDQAALVAIRHTHPGPPMVARMLAVLHTCIYDAWAAYDPMAVGTRLGGFLRRPTAEHTSANKQRAI